MLSWIYLSKILYAKSNDFFEWPANKCIWYSKKYDNVLKLKQQNSVVLNKVIIRQSISTCYFYFYWIFLIYIIQTTLFNFQPFCINDLQFKRFNPHYKVQLKRTKIRQIFKSWIINRLTLYSFAIVRII